MSRIIDMTGQQWGKLTILKRDTSRKSKQAYWLCRCSCGNPEIRSILGTNLRKGATTSCGKCGQFELPGQQFGRLTVIEIDLEYKQKHNIQVGSLYYRCRCDCGNIITAGINHLKNGNIQSCGCLNKEISTSVHSKDLTGQVFGNLTALYQTNKKNRSYNVWRCKCTCGNECDVTSGNLLRGSTRSCGCINSVGKVNIQQLLLKNNIIFEKEKTFDDLINLDTGYKYRYDFYLPSYNRLIEFDGIQHYEYTNHGWNTEQKFKETQKSDKVKNEYALSHNIDLIRIPYWERNNITLELFLGDKYLIKEENNE